MEVVTVKASRQIAVSYVPTTRRFVPWMVVVILVVTVAMGAAFATGAGALPLLVVLWGTVLVVVAYPLAFARVRVTVRRGGEGLTIEEDRLLAQSRRDEIEFVERPRVEVDEYNSATLVILGGEEEAFLTDTPAEEREGLRTQIGEILPEWQPAEENRAVPGAEGGRDADVDPVVAETRGLIVALIHGDHELARACLGRGAVADGHAQACGVGAPLFVAKLRGDRESESLLREEGAMRDQVDAFGLRMLRLLAQTENQDPLAEALERATALEEGDD